MYIRNHHFRFNGVVFSFIAFLLLLTARLSFIQFFRAQYLTQLAEKQHSFFVELEPKRGTIFDRNLTPLSFNIACDSLYAVPSQIIDKQKTARKLAAILDLDRDKILDRLERKKSFIWISRKLSEKKVKEIKELGIKGLNFIKESKRRYPNKELASHILGFVGLDNKGLEGLELKYDKYLKGELGWSKSIKDAKQRPLLLHERFIPPQDGYDLVLTIDETLQFIVEYELDRIYRKSKAKAAIIIIMDPNTGAILALANRPTFNLDNIVESSQQARRNIAITDYFEPGSVFKIVTASAALEEGKVSEEDKFFCENGKYRIANHILHDHKPHGWLTFKQVITESSNIGTIKVAQILGPDLVYKYVRLFGFGSYSGIDFPGEVPGVIKAPRYWSKISIGAVPIGHEVGVTALQLVNMVSCIANGGLLYKPYMVSRVQDAYGELIKEFKPQVSRRVISKDTASRMKAILAEVVAAGTGRLARLSNFQVAGKTGTAQKIVNGKYSHDKFVATFVGFVPVENPQIAMVVIVDEPKGTHYGGTVSAPTFKRVADKALKYLQSSGALEVARGD